MTQKNWGVDELVYRDDGVELHRLTIKAGGKSSEHHHNYMRQFLRVESGLLRVRTFDDHFVGIVPNDHGMGGHVDTDLEPGQAIQTEPNVVHCFEALADTIAYELYRPVIAHDIVRRA